MADPEKQFDEAMMNLYRTAKSDCGYNGSYFLKLLHDKRGIATAKQLLASDGAQTGFTKLYECGRLDLAVECLVLKPRFQSLFDLHELD